MVVLFHNNNTGNWEFGFYATGGGGLHLGINADLVIDIGFSNNNSIEELNGNALTIGGGVATPTFGPHAGIGIESSTPNNYCDAESTYTISPSIGIGLPAEGHAYITRTFSKALFAW